MPVDRRAVHDIAVRGTDTTTDRDPAIQRHKAELFGGEADADPTPPEQRYTQPGRVQLEWLGDVSPFAGEVMSALRFLHKLPKPLAAALEKVALSIAYRVDGLTTRTLTKERDGLTETITWGPRPGTYVREVTAKDADRILSGPAGRQFRVVGWDGAHPSRDPVDIYLPPSMRPMARSVNVRIGPEENLTGVVVGSHGRMGAWEPTTR